MPIKFNVTSVNYILSDSNPCYTVKYNNAVVLTSPDYSLSITNYVSSVVTYKIFRNDVEIDTNTAIHPGDTIKILAYTDKLNPIFESESTSFTSITPDTNTRFAAAATFPVDNHESIVIKHRGYGFGAPSGWTLFPYGPQYNTGSVSNTTNNLPTIVATKMDTLCCSNYYRPTGAHTYTVTPILFNDENPFTSAIQDLLNSTSSTAKIQLQLLTLKEKNNIIGIGKKYQVLHPMNLELTRTELMSTISNALSNGGSGGSQLTSDIVLAYNSDDGVFGLLYKATPGILFINRIVYKT